MAQNTSQKNTNKNGQVALIVVVLFMFISLTIAGSISALGVSHLRAANELSLGKKSFATAESGLEDVMLRLSDPFTYDNDPSETIMIAGQGNAYISYTGDTSSYSMTAKGDVSSRIRQIKTRAAIVSRPGDGFPAAVVAGFLGTVINGSNAWIENVIPTSKGNLFSNGSVAASQSGNNITGEIRVARPIAAASDDSSAQVQLNASTNTIVEMRKSDSNKDVAMSFIADKTAYITEIWLKIDRSTNSTNYPDMNVKILPNDRNFDRPLYLSSVISTRAVSYTAITPNISIPPTPPDWTKIRLNVNRPVYENERYWIVLDNSGTAYTNYYRLYGTDGIATSPTRYIPQRSCYNEVWCNTSDAAGNELNDGNVGRVKLSSDWTTGSFPQVSDIDIAFKVIFGEPTYRNQDFPLDQTNPYITKAVGINTGGAARVDTLNNATVGTDLASPDRQAYYTYTAGGVTAAGSPCGNSPSLNCNYGTQAPEHFPIITTSNDDHWRKMVYDYLQIAEAGGTQTVNGNITLGNDAILELGPAVVNGNITLNGNSVLILHSVVELNGTLTLNNTCSVKVKESDKDPLNGNGLDAYIIVTTGKADVGNGCTFVGSGDPGKNKSSVKIFGLYYNPLTANNLEPQNTINIANTTSGDVALFAPMGEVHIANSAQVSAISAARVTIENSARVKYKSALVLLPPPGGDTGGMPDFSAYYEQ